MSTDAALVEPNDDAGDRWVAEAATSRDLRGTVSGTSVAEVSRPVH